MIDVLRRFHNSLQFVVIPARSFKAYLDSTQTPDFEYFSRLSWETSTPENPQIKVILCQNEARGGTYVLADENSVGGTRVEFSSSI